MKIMRPVLMCLLCFTFGHHETSVAQPQIVTSFLNACGYVCSIAAASMGYPNSGFLGYQEPTALDAFIDRLLNEADAIVLNDEILLNDIPKYLHALHIKFMKEGLIDDLPVPESAISRLADLRVQYKTLRLVADIVKETIDSTDWTRMKDYYFVENIVWGEEGQLVWPYLDRELSKDTSNLEEALSSPFLFEITFKARGRIRDILHKLGDWARASRQRPEDTVVHPATYYIFTVYQLSSFAFLRTMTARSTSERTSQYLRERMSEDEAEKFLSEIKERMSQREVRYYSNAIWPYLRLTELSLLKKNLK